MTKRVTYDMSKTGIPSKTIELTLPNNLGYEKVAMASVAAVAERMGFSPARTDDLKTALSEACINAMEYGNQLNADMKVVVVLTIRDDELEINVADSGLRKYNPETDARSSQIEDRMEGVLSTRGWGMFLIQSLMDEVEFTTSPAGGNQLKMVIHLKKGAEETR